MNIPNKKRKILQLTSSQTIDFVSSKIFNSSLITEWMKQNDVDVSGNFLIDGNAFFVGYIEFRVSALSDIARVEKGLIQIAKYGLYKEFRIVDGSLYYNSILVQVFVKERDNGIELSFDARNFFSRYSCAAPHVSGYAYRNMRKLVCQNGSISATTEIEKRIVFYNR